MSDKGTACGREREALVEAFMSEGAHARLSAGLRRHLEQCASCRRYWEALGAVPLGFPETPLYSPALKQRTLRRMAGQKPAADYKSAAGARWLPLIVPAALLSLTLSLLIPGWLLARVFLHWTASTAMAYGAGYGILMLLGTLVTVAAGISLAERGLVAADSGEGCRA